ncbi:hypothetical protein [Bacillus smithii]|uniref:hypothetical protein n=1 Tax=Bacillus smithii TaxID=1479 RepID=UPI0030C907D5
MASYEYYHFSKDIRDKLRPLYQSNNYRGAIGLLYDCLVIALAIYLGKISIILYPLSVLVIGARQRAKEH